MTGHYYSHKELTAIDSFPATPFLIELENGHHDIECTEVLRFVPKKRLIAYAIWQRKEVVVKIFYHKKHAERDCGKDVTGNQLLVRHHISTPALLHHGRGKDPKIHILIFEKIKNSTTLEELLQENEKEKSILLLKLLIEEIGKQVRCGLYQSDLNLKNFLLSREKLYTIDCNKIKTIKNKKSFYAPLCEIFSRLNFLDRKNQENLIELYAKHAGLIIQKKQIEKISKKTKKIKENLKNHYLQKAFRSSTQFKKIKNKTQWIVLERTFATKECLNFLKNINNFFPASNQGQPSFQEGFFKIGSMTLLARHYKDKKNISTWFSPLFKSKAAKDWYHHHHLKFLGLSKRHPIAFIENRSFFFRTESYIVFLALK